MSDRSLADTAEGVQSLLGPRATPSTRFVQTLREDIEHAAYDRLGRGSIPFEQMVVELRKLVRLLCRTLVPVRASATFVRALGHDLDVSAREIISARHERVRWLMLGGVMGSLLSLLGVLAALLLRRKNGRVGAKKPVGVT